MGNFAQGISNQGQVVGFSDLPGDITNDAFLWTEEQGMHGLGTLPGDVGSGAWAVNDKGQIVGLGSRAILWENGVLTDLNTLVPGPPFSPLYLLSAYDINTSGEIVGLGLAITGEMHGFLAIPCDEAAKGCGDEVTADSAAIVPIPTSIDSLPGAQGSSAAIGGQIGRILDRFRAPRRYFPRPESWTTR
jgi:probable HAF family extracellular repeat protein